VTDLPSADRDAEDLRSFGYRSELRRTLSGLAAFAASFAVISVVVGLFTAYQLGFAFAGPGVVWAVLVVAIGQFLVALVFAELAARYPIAGSVFQWAKGLGGPIAGFMTSWIYIWAWLIVLPSVALGLQATLLTLSPSLHVLPGATPETGTLSFAQNMLVLGAILVGITTLVNLAGVRFVALASYLGLITEFVGLGLLFAILVGHIQRGPGVLTNDLGLGAGHAWGYFGALLVGAFLPMYIFFGFDTGASLAEETNDPRRHGPQALLRSIGLAGLVAVIACALVPIAVNDINNEEIAIGGLQFVVGDLANSTIGNVLLVDAAVAIVCAAIAIHALISRLIFSMARDSELPYSRALSSVAKRTRSPWVATLIPTAVWLAIMAINLGNSKVFNALLGVGVLLVFVSYLLLCVFALRRRVRGSLGPVSGLFSLRWGMPVTVVAVLWLALCCVNLMWPRAEFYGTEWYQQYSALIVTGAVVLLGALMLVLKPRGTDLGKIRPEHRASPASEEVGSPVD
jgi:urea carboxylase system permease